MGSFDYLLREPAKTATTSKTPATASAEEGICGFRGFCSDETLAPLATDFEERSAIAQFDAGVPREWAEGYASLQCQRVPIGFSSERWMRVITDGGRFLDLWGTQAAALGWDAADVFGVDIRAPGTRLDAMGLVFFIDGHAVKAITGQTARLIGDNGVAMTYFRRTPSQKGMPVWSIL